MINCCGIADISDDDSRSFQMFAYLSPLFGGDEPIVCHKLPIGLKQEPSSLYLQLFVGLFVIANSSEYVLFIRDKLMWFSF